MHLAVTWEVFMDLVTWEVDMVDMWEGDMVDMWEGDLADTWDNSSPLIHTFHIHHPLAEDTYKIFNISSVISNHEYKYYKHYSIPNRVVSTLQQIVLFA